MTYGCLTLISYVVALSVAEMSYSLHCAMIQLQLTLCDVTVTVRAYNLRNHWNS